MAKSNKSVSSTVAAAVKAVNPSFAAALLAKAEAVAAQAVDVQISTAETSDNFRAAFADLCIEAGVPVIKRDGVEVFDRESEIGKALHEVLKAKATESARTRAHYSVEVHRIGDQDKYLPVRIWSSLRRKWMHVDVNGNAVDPNDVADHGVALRESNHTFTAAFALGTDLKALPSVVESPNGAKAWLRGTMAGCRPDGKGQGMRDWIKNDVDQALSRGWRIEASGRAGGNRQDFADLLNGLHKAGIKKRARFAKDNGDDSVVSEAQWAALCSIMVEAAFDPALADEIIASADRAGS